MWSSRRYSKSQGCDSRTGSGAHQGRGTVIPDRIDTYIWPGIDKESCVWSRYNTGMSSYSGREVRYRDPAAAASDSRPGVELKLKIMR